MNGEVFETKGGHTFEHGAVLTFGVRSLRIDSSQIVVVTVLGGERTFPRDEVRSIRLGKSKGVFGRWFSVEMLDGTEPDLLFGGNKNAILDALENSGWPVEVD